MSNRALAVVGAGLVLVGSSAACFAQTALTIPANFDSGVVGSTALSTAGVHVPLIIALSIILGVVAGVIGMVRGRMGGRKRLI